MTDLLSEPRWVYAAGVLANDGIVLHAHTTTADPGQEMPRGRGTGWAVPNLAVDATIGTAACGRTLWVRETWCAPTATMLTDPAFRRCGRCTATLAGETPAPDEQETPLW